MYILYGNLLIHILYCNLGVVIYLKKIIVTFWFLKYNLDIVVYLYPILRVIDYEIKSTVKLCFFIEVYYIIIEKMTERF